MQKWSDSIFAQRGQTMLTAPGATVTILTYPGGALATLFSDNGVTVTTNPLTADSTGRVSFYAANGRYTPVVNYLGLPPVTLPDIILEDDPVQQTETPPYAGGTTRLLSSKIYDIVSVLDFGAVADGVTDNTAAFSAALNSGRKILIPAGTYACQTFNLVSNRIIEGEGAGTTTIIPTPTTAFNSLVFGNAVTNVEISGLTINAPKASFPTMGPVYFQASSNINIHDLNVPSAGFTGIYTTNCTDVVVERCVVRNCTVNGINHDGASSARTTTRDCNVSISGNTNHGIAISGGADHAVTNNFCTLCTIFGVSVFNASRVKVIGNTCFNTTREGINATDSSDVTVAENIVYWDTTTSQDFGMSFAGQAAANSFHVIRGNKVVNCGKSGIALAATPTNVQNCTIQGNTIENSNRLNNGTTNGNGGGIILYGTNCQNNLISDNKIFDNIGNLQFGIYEWTTSGSGSPAANKVFDNDVLGQAQTVTSLTANSYEALNSINAVSYTPTISAGSGTLTSASATGSYVLSGKLVFFRATGVITTNGTGASSIFMSLPFTSASGFGVVVSGRDTTLSGKAVAGTIGSSVTTVNCLFYDNTYPGANGATITVSGSYVRS